MKILLLSDTHNYIDQRILHYANTVDEIWHAGDIGTLEVTDALLKIKPIVAVYGNIDNQLIRRVFKKNEIFEREGLKIFMTHIGASPGKYSTALKNKLKTLKPNLFVCGHSHIAKLQYDKDIECLYANPGAAGIYGNHKVRTMFRFEINKGKIENFEVIELGTKL